MPADYNLAFWIVLALFILFILVTTIIYIVMSFYLPEGSDGIFRVKGVTINHLNAKSMDVLVHTVYTKKARITKLPDYADIVKTINTVMGSSAVAKTSPWEVVAKDLGKQIWNDYDVVGVSVELLIPGTNGNTQNATYTRGYGCTRMLHLDSE